MKIIFIALLTLIAGYSFSQNALDIAFEELLFSKGVSQYAMKYAKNNKTIEMTYMIPSNLHIKNKNNFINKSEYESKIDSDKCKLTVILSMKDISEVYKINEMASSLSSDKEIISKILLEERLKYHENITAKYDGEYLNKGPMIWYQEKTAEGENKKYFSINSRCISIFDKRILIEVRTYYGKGSEIDEYYNKSERIRIMNAFIRQIINSIKINSI
jgi:hypothetical protein